MTIHPPKEIMSLEFLFLTRRPSSLAYVQSSPPFNSTPLGSSFNTMYNDLIQLMQPNRLSNLFKIVKNLQIISTIIPNLTQYASHVRLIQSYHNRPTLKNFVLNIPTPMTSSLTHNQSNLPFNTELGYLYNGPTKSVV